MADPAQLRLVFMGTPDFAVPSLDILRENGYDIAGVVTAPDKPSGRGLKVSQSAVKKYASSYGLPVLQPPRLKDPEFIRQLKALKADIQVVVAFRMLPEMVWNMPPLGTINLHASLLPQYRGAAPINWAILNGEKETGVTTFKLQHDIDTGAIIFQDKVSIGDHQTAGELHDELMHRGAALLLKTIRAIVSGDYRLIPQSQLPVQAIHHAPKIFKDDARISWSGEVDSIYNLIRGLSPYPTAWTTLNGKILKIFTSAKTEDPGSPEPGTAQTDHLSFLRIAAVNGWIYLEEIQLEGKKRMDIAGFLRGYRDEQIMIC